MNILKIKIKEKWFKFLFIQFYKSQYIELNYNFLENRIYYKDKNKNIPTGKDLCRSIKMIYEMIKRALAFNNSFTVINDDLDVFVLNLLKSLDTESNSIIFGTKTFSFNRFVDYCNAIEINSIQNVYELLNNIYKNIKKKSSIFLDEE